MARVLVVVPARAGSVGVPGKNLRTLAGVPLVARTLASLTAVAGSFAADPDAGIDLAVVVSTDDPAVAAIAAGFAVPVVWRTPDLADAAVPLADVVADVLTRYDGPAPDWVGCAQVTSPNVELETYADAIHHCVDADAPSLSLVAPETHLRWAESDETGWRLLGDPINRQWAPTATRRETGALRLARPDVLAEYGWLGHPDHVLVDLDESEADDIDTHADLAAARTVAERLRVEFIVACSPEVGSGHLHRCLALARELAANDLVWRWANPDPPAWAVERVAAAGIAAPVAPDNPEPVNWPDVFVVDALDLAATEAGLAASFGVPVVALEPGPATAAVASLVIDELAPPAPGALTGPRYAVLRPEFVGPYVPPPGDRSVLVTFGGTDPAGANAAIAGMLSPLADRVVVAAGPGAGPRPDWLPASVEWVVNGSMVALMRAADVVVSSSGRTVAEAAAVGRPVVAIAVNGREERHWRPDPVVYLGRVETVTAAPLVAAVRGFLNDPDWARAIGWEMRGHVDPAGAERVARWITTTALDLG